MVATGLGARNARAVYRSRSSYCARTLAMHGTLTCHTTLAVRASLEPSLPRAATNSWLVIAHNTVGLPFALHPLTCVYNDRRRAATSSTEHTLWSALHTKSAASRSLAVVVRTDALVRDRRPRSVLRGVA